MKHSKGFSGDLPLPSISFVVEPVSCRYLPDEKEEDLERMLLLMREGGLTVQLLATRHIGASTTFDEVC